MLRRPDADVEGCRMKKKGVIALLAAALAGGVFWLAREPDDPETRIRAVIAAVIAAAEQRDLGGIMKHVSRDFRSPELDRNELKGLLFVELRRGDWRRVVLVKTVVQLADTEHARVVLVALLASGDDVLALEDLLRTDADTYRFDVTMALEEDEWRVTTAAYEPARAANLLDSLRP
jgi:hypothetical protein